MTWITGPDPAGGTSNQPGPEPAGRPEPGGPAQDSYPPPPPRPDSSYPPPPPPPPPPPAPGGRHDQASPTPAKTGAAGVWARFRAFKRWQQGLIVFGLLVLLGAVLPDQKTSGGTGTDMPSTTATGAGTTATTAPNTTTTVATSPEKSVSRISVPRVVGKNLQLAQDTMQAAGLYNLTSHDSTGLGRLQVLDRNWVVTDQSPLAGTLVSEDQLIDLGAKKFTD